MRLKFNLKGVEPSKISYRGKLAESAKTCGWVLCVGAGTSDGIFPCWNELAGDLLRRSDLACTKAEIDRFLKCFGPEPLIQAAANASESNELPDIANVLSEALYARLRAKSGIKWGAVAKALTSSKPFNLKTEEWQTFDQIISTFPNASAPDIARVIADVIGTHTQPEAIVSFNAEPLLYGLINCYYGLKNPDAVKTRSDVKILKRLSHDLATRTRGQLPYYYVHGVLPVPEGRPNFNKSISADKLVFTETQYLQLSRSAYSWQAATFLASCIHHRCVFIGLSFSDPNLRRWLAWEHEGKAVQRKQRDLPANRLKHFWLKRRPHKKDSKLSAEQRLLEASVEHLGVRIVWLDKWSEAGDMLRSMLSTE